MKYKYQVDYTSDFIKKYKKIKKHNKDLEKLKFVINELL